MVLALASAAEALVGKDLSGLLACFPPRGWAEASVGSPRVAAWRSPGRSPAPARFVRLTRGQVREVNRRYAKPEIETTLFAKTCLVSLRVYLVVLVGLMVFKFIAAALQG